ncbi:hypothetical protein CKK34_2044 [Yarrowia sp. E02]|nr:hypothetical protein CKK34_2044 [Yarrowia sp. E02]
MANMVVRQGFRGAMYDWRGVSSSMENIMNQWIGYGWNIELILFDGLTPRNKMKVMKKLLLDQILTATRAISLSTPAGAAAVCHSTLLHKFPQINCKIAPGETDAILSSIAYNYAKKHPDTPTYLMSGDSDFLAFDFPDNVTILDTEPETMDLHRSINLTPKVREAKSAPASALAFSKLTHSHLHNAVMDPRYFDYAEKQMLQLTRFNVSDHKEYVLNDELMRSYRVLENRPFDEGAHKVVNAVSALEADPKSDQGLFTIMPIMCERQETEFCFEAGRRWRSLAYQMIIEQTTNKRHSEFYEYGRQVIHFKKAMIPVSDGAREKHDKLEKDDKKYNFRRRRLPSKPRDEYDRLLAQVYYYGSKESITNEIKGWKTAEDVVEAIYKEIIRTSPVQPEELKYSPAIAESYIKTFLREVFDPVARNRNPESDRGLGMTATSKRLYNKILACVMSLRLLQSAGLSLPVDVELFHLDAARWRDIVLQTSSPNHKPIMMRHVSGKVMKGKSKKKDERKKSPAEKLADRMRQLALDQEASGFVQPEIDLEEVYPEEDPLDDIALREKEIPNHSRMTPETERNSLPESPESLEGKSPGKSPQKQVPKDISRTDDVYIS